MFIDSILNSAVILLSVVTTILTSINLLKRKSTTKAFIKLGFALKGLVFAATIVASVTGLFYKRKKAQKQDIESIPYIDLLYTKKMSILLFVSSCTVLLLIFITIVNIKLPIPVWIVISSYLAIVAAYQFTISYRFNHGFYGLNRYEAKELIEFVLKERANGSTPGGRPIYNMQLPEQTENINEGSAVPNVQS